MASTRPVLKKGMSGKAGTAIGDAIFLWRNFIGLAPAVGVTVFDFGTQSYERTIQWQKSYGLKSDGVVGPATWARYDSLQYGPPTAEAAKAAEQLKSPEQPSPAAVQAAKVIKAKKPALAPTPAAVTAASKIPTPTKPPSTPITIPGTTVKLPVVVTDVKNAAMAASSQVNALIEKTPLWVRITGTTLGVVMALKGLKKLFAL